MAHFRATDGRPFDVEAWYVTDTNGNDVVALANSQRNPLPIDYEHPDFTLTTKRQKKPQVRGGWITFILPQRYFCRCALDGQSRGLYQKRGEYRYISAVFSYDTQGYVAPKSFTLRQQHASFLDGMDEQWWQPANNF